MSSMFNDAQNRTEKKCGVPVHFVNPQRINFINMHKCAEMQTVAPHFCLIFFLLPYAATANGMHAEMSNSDNRRDFSLLSALLSAASASLS